MLPEPRTYAIAASDIQDTTIVARSMGWILPQSLLVSWHCIDLDRKRKINDQLAASLVLHSRSADSHGKILWRGVEQGSSGGLDVFLPLLPDSTVSSVLTFVIPFSLCFLRLSIAENFQLSLVMGRGKNLKLIQPIDLSLSRFTTRYSPSPSESSSASSNVLSSSSEFFREILFASSMTAHRNQE